MPRFSDEFYTQVEPSVRGLGAVSAELVVDDVFPRVLNEWFAVLWHAMRGTIPLFNHAVARLGSCPNDDFHRKLRDFYLHKIEEETGHDQMILEDLARLGVTPEQLHRTLAPAPVAALIGSQYYLIDFAHPCAYLGYMALIEGNPLQRAPVRRVLLPGARRAARSPAAGRSLVIRPIGEVRRPVRSWLAGVRTS